MKFHELTTLQKRTLVENLHKQRIELLTQSIKTRAKKVVRKKRKKKLKFASPELERIFNSMDKEQQQLILKGK